MDLRGDRSITLRHLQHDRVPLSEDDAKETIKHVHRLWHFDVHVETMQDDEVTARYICDDESVRKVSSDKSAQVKTKVKAKA